MYLRATTATLTNNSITGNTGYGGGVYLSATTATLTNNDISGNTPARRRRVSERHDRHAHQQRHLGQYRRLRYGGGVYLSATTATLTNNTISGNTGSRRRRRICATTATLTNNTSRAIPPPTAAACI